MEAKQGSKFATILQWAVIKMLGMVYNVKGSYTGGQPNCVIALKCREGSVVGFILAEKEHLEYVISSYNNEIRKFAILEEEK